MKEQLLKLQELGLLLQNHGLKMVLSLSILILGLFAIKWILRTLKGLLKKVIKNTKAVDTTSIHR